MQPTVLLLLPTSTYRAHDLLAAARAQQIAVVVGSEVPQALEGHSGGTTATIDVGDPEAATRQILAIAERTPLSAVLGLDDETVLAAATAAAALGLPHASADAVRILGNKFAFRQLQRAHGLPCPEVVAARAGRPGALTERVGFPCVVKPSFLSASRGVIRADDEAQLRNALARVHELLQRPSVAARAPEGGGHVIVERFVPGPEVAVEMLLSAGKAQTLALFDKPDPLDGPFFEETIYVTPSRHPAGLQAEICAAVCGTLAAAGLEHGPVHAEVRIDPVGGPTVIEAAPRSIGGLCGRVLSFATAGSLEEIIIRHAVGREITTERTDGAAGVMMLPIPHAGVLRSISGLDAARATPGIEEAVISIHDGQEVEPLPEGNRYLGFIFSRADSPEAAEAALRQAFAELVVEID